MVRLSLTNVLIGLVAISPAFATPVARPDPEFAFSTPREKRAAKNPVVGLTDGVVSSTGQVPFRVEIRSMTGDKLNLFLLGLRAMQSTSYSNPLSFYEIAGIHGRPYTGWNGEAATGNADSGYCTHSSLLFPTWHRPYLALYEQTLHAAMQTVVNSFSGSARTKYQTALNGWRMPYWDWAKNNGQMPAILTTKTIRVTTPSGSKSIRNPLFGTVFTTLSQTDFPNPPFYIWKATLRYPNNQEADAYSQNGLVNQQLASSASSLTQRVYQLFVNSVYNAYADFSNKASNTGAPDSLEAVHDTIHALTGNGGHMSYIDYAAFDPIFFLHHTNIDRLFALWQAVNHRSWIGKQTNPYGTYGEPVGTVETEYTALTPFYTTAGSFHTSNTARYTQSFGYTYPELSYWKYKNNPDGFAAAVKKEIISLYGGTNAAVAASSKKRQTGQLTTTAGAKTYYDWRVDIHTNKFILGGSYFIHIFLGNPNSLTTNSSLWSVAPTLVGDYAIFMNKAASPPAADTVCGIPLNLVSGSIPLTQALINDIGAVGSLNPAAVTAYLKENLTWKISMMDDSPVDAADVCDLAISVSAALVTLPPAGEEATEFPTYGVYQNYLNVTDGKVGGGLPNATSARLF